MIDDGIVIPYIDITVYNTPPTDSPSSRASSIITEHDKLSPIRPNSDYLRLTSAIPRPHPAYLSLQTCHQHLFPVRLTSPRKRGTRTKCETFPNPPPLQQVPHLPHRPPTLPLATPHNAPPRRGGLVRRSSVARGVPAWSELARSCLGCG